MDATVKVFADLLEERFGLKMESLLELLREGTTSASYAESEECVSCGAERGAHARACEVWAWLRALGGEAEEEHQLRLCREEAEREHRRRSDSVFLGSDLRGQLASMEEATRLFRELYGARDLGLDIRTSPFVPSVVPSGHAYLIGTPPRHSDLMDAARYSSAIMNVEWDAPTRDPQRPWRTCRCVGPKHAIDCAAA